MGYVPQASIASPNAPYTGSRNLQSFVAGSGHTITSTRATHLAPPGGRLQKSTEGKRKSGQNIGFGAQPVTGTVHAKLRIMKSSHSKAVEADQNILTILTKSFAYECPF